MEPFSITKINSTMDGGLRFKLKLKLSGLRGTFTLLNSMVWHYTTIYQYLEPIWYVYPNVGKKMVYS